MNTGHKHENLQKRKEGRKKKKKKKRKQDLIPDKQLQRVSWIQRAELVSLNDTKGRAL